MRDSRRDHGDPGSDDGAHRPPVDETDVVSKLGDIAATAGLRRIAMLAWAVWLALALLKWLKWGWECFTNGGLWRDLRRSGVTQK